MDQRHICDKEQRIIKLEEEKRKNDMILELGKYFIDILFSRKVIWLVFLISFIFNLMKGG